MGNHKQLTKQEKPHNFLSGKILYNTRWEKHVGRYRITYEHRSKQNFWGRFGGGWNWNLGFQASNRTLILNLLVASLRIYRKDKTDD